MPHSYKTDHNSGTHIGARASFSCHLFQPAMSKSHQKPRIDELDFLLDPTGPRTSFYYEKFLL